MDKLIVANWKMEKTYSESVAWVKKYKSFLVSLDSLVLCPSYTALSSLEMMLRDTRIQLGAQDCSAHERGPFTADVSVLSLKELGCAYCIVGHSERRHYYNETSMIVAQKAALLVQHGIGPIICVGESASERTKRKYEILSQQLDPVIQALAKISPSSSALDICIAYEPLWAVGTEEHATTGEVHAVSSWIKNYVMASLPTLSLKVLYGGHVTASIIGEYKNSMHLDGFLLGRSGLEAKSLEQIIRLL